MSERADPAPFETRAPLPRVVARYRFVELSALGVALSAEIRMTRAGAVEMLWLRDAERGEFYVRDRRSAAEFRRRHRHRPWRSAPVVTDPDLWSAAEAAIAAGAEVSYGWCEERILDTPEGRYLGVVLIIEEIDDGDFTLFRLTGQGAEPVEFQSEREQLRWAARFGAP